MYECLGKNGCGRGAITGDVIGLLGNFLHQFGADALKRIFEVDFLGDRHAVFGDRGSSPLLVEDNVAALGAKRDLDGVSQKIQTALHATARFLIKMNELGHAMYIPSALRIVGTVPATDDSTGNVLVSLPV